MDRDAISSEIRKISRINTVDVSDTELAVFINEGVNVVSTAFNWSFLTRTTSLSSAVGDAALPALPTEVQSILAVSHELDNNGVVEQISYRTMVSKYGADQADWDTGSPAKYWALDSSTGAATAPEIILWPVPTAIVAYEVLHVVAPTLLTTGATAPQWVSMFHHILVDYALYRLYQRVEFYNQSEAAFDRFRRTLADMKRFYETKRTQRFPIIFGGTGGKVLDPRENLPFD